MHVIAAVCHFLVDHIKGVIEHGTCLYPHRGGHCVAVTVTGRAKDMSESDVNCRGQIKIESLHIGKSKAFVITCEFSCGERLSDVTKNYRTFAEDAFFSLQGRNASFWIDLQICR